MQIQWQEGRDESVEIGYLNPHGQQCCGHCGVLGTDHGQYEYKTECAIYGYVYGTNGFDVYERRCPECQEGAARIKYWKSTDEYIRFQLKGQGHPIIIVCRWQER